MRRIKTSIVIAAPPERVWSILDDFEAWATWNNVLHVASAGHHVGSTVRFRPLFTASPERGYSARIVQYEPGRELAWFGSPLKLRALACGRHWFHLRPTEEGTLFEHGEDFGGLLTPLMPKAYYATLTKGFETFNRALKDHAERAVA